MDDSKSRLAHVSSRTMRMLRLRGVEECVGFSRSAIYRAMEEDGFPRPVKIGRRAVAWVESEILAWLELKLAAREGRA